MPQAHRATARGRPRLRPRHAREKNTIKADGIAAGTLHMLKEHYPGKLAAFPADEGSGVSGGDPKIREGTSAILISTDGRLLFQLRDNFANIPDPGKLDFFGGGREANESFLDCVVREVHEEIGLYLPPDRFEYIGRDVERDHWVPDCTLHNEIFLARDVPINRLTITEGTLEIIAFDELQRIDSLAPSARRALEIFLKHEGRGLVDAFAPPRSGDLRAGGAADLDVISRLRNRLKRK